MISEVSILLRQQYWRGAVLLTLAVLALVSFNPVSVQADEPVPVSDDCLLTPNQIGGQGFATFGLGFETFGLGFETFGLGFETFGLGFQTFGLGFATFGLDGVDLAAEVDTIANSQITAEWVGSLLGNVEGTIGYGDVAVKIVVVDDFSNPADDPSRSHGTKVLEVLQNTLDTYPNTNVEVLTLDIGAAGIGYQVGNLLPQLEALIDGIRAAAESNNQPTAVVLNLSFGVVNCEDPATGVNVLDLIEEVNAAESQALDPEPIQPQADCIQEVGEGQYLAHFNYFNPNAEIIVELPSENNYLLNLGLSADVAEAVTPTYFTPGQVGAFPDSAFQVPFDGNLLIWEINGQAVGFEVSSEEESEFEATYDFEIPITTEFCDEPYAYSSPPEIVKGVLECVADNGDGTFTAHFGYINNNEVTSYVPFGPLNKLTGGGLTNAQLEAATPKYFGQLGRTPFFPDSAFQVIFDAESTLVWTHSGGTSSASASGDRCEFPRSGGIAELIEEQTVGETTVEEVFANLIEAVDDNPLGGLRGYLQGLLAESAGEASLLQVVAVASAGNFAPWLGNTPLAPAVWPETVAVSAGVTNAVNPWTFSQDGNIRAPGVSFAGENGAVLAGSSYAAPNAARYLSEILSVADACTYPQIEENGALIYTAPVVNPTDFSNLVPQPTTEESLAPFTCSVLRPSDGPERKVVVRVFMDADNDANDNGDYDFGLQGWTIRLQNKNGPNAEAVTGPNGFATFRDIDPNGDYTVRVTTNQHGGKPWQNGWRAARSFGPGKGEYGSPQKWFVIGSKFELDNDRDFVLRVNGNAEAWVRFSVIRKQRVIISGAENGDVFTFERLQPNDKWRNIGSDNAGPNGFATLIAGGLRYESIIRVTSAFYPEASVEVQIPYSWQPKVFFDQETKTLSCVADCGLPGGETFRSTADTLPLPEVPGGFRD